MKRSFLLVGVFGAAVLFAPAFFSKNADAQTKPEVFITWKTDSYAPPEFLGKLLPAPRSRVTAAIDVFENGKRVDVSGETIYWYVDGKFAKGGKGVQTFSFYAADRPGGSQELRAQFDGYKKLNIPVLGTIDIPIASPETVIESRLPENRFSGTNIQVYGKLYFFNVTDISKLTFAWQVNGKKPTGEDVPSRLTINVSGVENIPVLRVSLMVQNPKNNLEGAYGSLTLSPRQ